jgi:hypothetical protein
LSLVAEIHDVLEELVERYQVCWDVYPHEEMANGARVQTGFDVELDGTHRRDVEHPSPGCQHCVEVYDALETIALNIIPQTRRPSRYDLSPFDQSIRYSHMRHDRPDVMLTITISHRNDLMALIDECEVRCLDEIKAKLQEIGAERRTWDYRKHGRAVETH